MGKQVIYSDRVMKPIAHFSHAARVGNLIHVGATAGTDAQRRLEGTSIGLVDVAAQTRKMFENVGIVLELLGARLEHTVRVKTYIADIRDQQRYRELYTEAFGLTAPDHIVVGSAGFPLPQAAIELDLVAVVDAPIVRMPDVGVRADGRFYCSTAGAPDRGDFATQATVALRSICDGVEQGGFSRSDIVYLHVTLADSRDAPAFGAALARTFPTEPPACTLVTASPSDPRSLLQIEAIAAAGGGHRLAGPKGAAGIGAAAVLAGDDLYIGGQVGEGDDGQLVAGGEAQTRAAWERIRAILDEAGMDARSIVRTNNVLTDWRLYADFNAGYGANVSDPYPPRATVLGGLPRYRALVQIEAVAHRLGSEAVIVQVPD